MIVRWSYQLNREKERVSKKERERLGEGEGKDDEEGRRWRLAVTGEDTKRETGRPK